MKGSTGRKKKKRSREDANAPEGLLNGGDEGQRVPEGHSDLECSQDSRTDIVVLVALVVLLFGLILIPGSWLNAASMWCRDYIPGF